VSKWMREVWAINCRTSNKQNKNAAQPHEATPSAGEAH
jgi:hypothetical protein